MPRRALNPPDLNTPGGRLRWARENYAMQRGETLSIRKAAERFRWPKDTYKSHEQGKRLAQGLKEKTAAIYAEAYGVRLEWLMSGRGPPLPEGVSEPDPLWQGMTTEERNLLLRLARALKPT